MGQTPTPSPHRNAAPEAARPDEDDSIAETLGRAIGEVVTGPASTEDRALDDALNPGVDSKPPPPAKPGEPQLS